MPQDGTSCIFAITSTGWASGVGCSQGHGLRATTILRLDSTTSQVAGMYQYKRWSKILKKQILEKSKILIR